MKAFCFTIWFSVCLTMGANSQYSVKISSELLQAGDEYYKKGDYKKSEEIYRAALSSFRQDTDNDNWLIAAVGLGASLIDQGNIKSGALWITKADSIKSERTPIELQAYIKSNIGWITWWLNSADEALTEYRKALQLAEQSENEFRIAQIKNSLALIEYETGYYESALRHATGAVNYFRSVGDSYLLSMTLSNLFSIYNELGLSERAEKTLLESLALKRDMGNNYLIASDYVRLGRFYKERGEYDKALYYLSEHLNESEQLISRAKRLEALSAIGSIYTSLNRLPEALAFYKEAGGLRTALNYDQDDVSTLGEGVVHQLMGNYNEAEQFYKVGLDFSLSNNNSLSAAAIYLKLAELNLLTNNTESALANAKNAAALIDRSESRRLKAELAAVNSKIYTQKQEYDTALSYAGKAFEHASIFKDYVQVDYLKLLAKSYHRLQSDSAFYYAELAFNEIEHNRMNIFGSNLQAGVFENHAEFYNLVAGWYLELKNDRNKAFELIEKGKSRVLLDQLSSTIVMEDIVDEASLIRIHQQEKNIDKLYRGLEESRDSVSTRKIRSQIYTAELEYENQLNQLRLNYPDLKQFDPINSIPITELAALSDEKTAFIEYAFAENALFTFWITKNKTDYRVHRFEEPAADVVNRYILNFRKAIERLASFEELDSLSAPVYSILLQPFLDSHPGINQLFIIPDQGIAYLPFDALVADKKYLLESLNFKFLPSSTLYSYIKEGSPGHKKNLLALAGSGFDMRADNRISSMAGLPASLLEIDSITKNFAESTVSKMKSSPESDFKSLNLSNYKYIHFATHALINELNPLQSGLLLNNSNLESIYGEDGYLTSLEISSLNLTSNLVVLSACNTGFGVVVPGEGLLGLQRSFLKAGATAVVVSLWSVYDRSTAEFMDAFYSQLNVREAEEFGWWQKLKQYTGFYKAPLFDYKAKAIRDAKLAMLQHPYYNHPVYWAPFILIGK